MTSAERAADEVIVAAVWRPAAMWVLAEQVAADLDPADVGEALSVLAGLCAAALEEVARLRGLEVGKVLDDYLGGEQATATEPVVDVAERIVELRRGGATYKAIAQTLTAEGWTRVEPWSAAAVQDVMRVEAARRGAALPRPRSLRARSGPVLAERYCHSRE